jgi:hypothetical protein
MRKNAEDLFVDSGIGGRNWYVTVSLGFKELANCGGHAVQSGIENEKLVCILVSRIRKVIHRVQDVDSGYDNVVGSRKNISGAASDWCSFKSIDRGYSYQVNIFLQNSCFYLLCEIHATPPLSGLCERLYSALLPSPVAEPAPKKSAEHPEPVEG